MLQDVDDTTARGILSRGDIAAVSWFDSVNYKLDQDYRIGGKLTAVCGTEEAYITDIRTDEYTGRFPRGADEIMLSTNAEELLGIHIGDRITLTTPAGDVEYTVSGLRYDESAVFMTRSSRSWTRRLSMPSAISQIAGIPTPNTTFASPRTRTRGKR